MNILAREAWGTALRQCTTDGGCALRTLIDGGDGRLHRVKKAPAVTTRAEGGSLNGRVARLSLATVCRLQHCREAKNTAVQLRVVN